MTATTSNTADGSSSPVLPTQVTAADALRGGDVPDLTTFRVAYRAARAETARLAETARAMATAGQRCGTRRAAAIAAYVEVTCGVVARQHVLEQTTLWPLLRAGRDGDEQPAAGGRTELDVDALTVAQRRLEPLLATAVEAAGMLAPKDHESAGRLVAALDALRDALADHLDVKESTVFPAVLARLSAVDWNAVAVAGRKRGNVREDLPRLAAYATPDELPAVLATAGRTASTALTFLLPALRRRQRLVFGRG